MAEKKAANMMIISQIYDFKIQFARLCYPTTFDQQKNEFLSHILPKNLQQLNQFCSQNEEEETINVKHLIIYDYLIGIERLHHQILKNYPKLINLMHKIRNNSKLKKYLHETESKRRINNKHATWQEEQVA